MEAAFARDVHLLVLSPFPEVAEAIQEELENYRSKEDEVKRLKHAMVSERASERVKTFLV